VRLLCKYSTKDAVADDGGALVRWLARLALEGREIRPADVQLAAELRMHRTRNWGQCCI
jgi:hypothetical protein